MSNFFCIFLYNGVGKMNKIKNININNYYYNIIINNIISILR